MSIKPIALALVALLGSHAASWAQETPSTPGARVYFINLKDGDTVTSPLNVKFGLAGMGIAPAGVQGDLVAGTGHHHLLIDTALEGDALKEPIPADEKHVHFGKGQTEATITLSPGRHTLQLLLGDWTHIPHHKPVMSERIAVTVK